MFIPLRVNFFYEREPLANYAVIALLLAGQLVNSVWDIAPLAALNRENPSGILTALFVHSNWFSAILNVLLLWVFGNALNSNLGTLRFVVVLLSFAVATGVLHLLLSEQQMLGASGVIAGLVGVFVAAYPTVEIDTISLWALRPKRVLIPAWFLAAIWFAVDLTAALLGSGTSAAAAGGLILGILAGILLKRAGILLHFEKSASYRRTFRQK